MSILIGGKIPKATLYYMSSSGVQKITTDEIFTGKKVIIFAVPGAFTPSCSERHLPGFLEYADQIKAKGVDTIACISVNDPYVMGAWAKDRNVGNKVLMLADGSGEFTKAVGQELNLLAKGLGIRSRRYAMIIEDGVVKYQALEEGGKLEVSTAENILEKL
ncbi:MAG: peroxiredoxin [Scytonematopsis contorta HA4267-MV1]|jgi:peroxiredoxin|nr:peroxiredoxin [Scytonematopsis contorta HA4267-MV1]